VANLIRNRWYISVKEKITNVILHKTVAYLKKVINMNTDADSNAILDKDLCDELMDYKDEVISLFANMPIKNLKEYHQK
jgi:hypothetical protein